jgi:uncharacterized protein (DUF924 family)
LRGAGRLQFWFGASDDATVTARDQRALWWSKDPAVDADMRRRFERLVLDAEAGRLDGWRATPQGRLALILLTDQFPRNIYRDTADAFRFDPRARALCLEGLERAADRALPLIQRVFFYLPLEHSESLPHQQLSVTLFEALAAEAPEALRPVFAGFAEFARKHRDIVGRFGRFPHRNALLGRRSTPEDLEFLRQPGSSF